MSSQRSSAEWAVLRHEYSQKNDLLASSGLLPTPPEFFYRELFPVGSLQSGPSDHFDGRGHGIAIEITGERVERQKPGGSYAASKTRRTFVDDDLRELYRLRTESDNFCFMSPVSYWGRSRSAANARQLFAFAVDLDGCGPKQLASVLRYASCSDQVWVPRPSYIVNSGTGLHLYYLLDAPVSLVPQVRPALQMLKTKLIDRVWMEDTSTLRDRQYQGIFQGFRIVGTQTKLNGAIGVRKDQGYEVVAWRTELDATVPPQRWSVAGLASALFGPSWTDRKQLADLNALFETGGRTPLSEAKRLWPDWYERRIIAGEPRGGWTTNRALYDSYLEKVRVYASEGHRYWCLFYLASCANKCGVSYEELEADALSLLPLFQGKDRPGNEFSLSDLYSALEFFDGGSADSPARRAKREYVENRTGIDLTPRYPRRNIGRTRGQALAAARELQDIADPDGSWRNRDGAPKKHMTVWNYAFLHPGVTKAEIARATGLSRVTVTKWLAVDGWINRYLLELYPDGLPSGITDQGSVIGSMLFAHGIDPSELPASSSASLHCSDFTT